MVDDDDLFEDDGIEAAIVADELYVTLPTKVVGVRYYNGTRILSPMRWYLVLRKCL